MKLLFGGPADARKVFVVCEWNKKLESLRFMHVLDLVLKCCSDTNGRKWIQLLFQFLVFLFQLVNMLASIVLLSFVYLCVRLEIRIFSYCCVTEMFAVEIQNRIDHDWVNFEFCSWNMPCFVDFIFAWTVLGNNCSNVFMFWRNQVFSILSLKELLVGSLNVPVFSSHGISQYRLMSFANQMHLYLLCEGIFHCSFLATLDSLLK